MEDGRKGEPAQHYSTDKWCSFTKRSSPQVPSHTQPWQGQWQHNDSPQSEAWNPFRCRCRPLCVGGACPDLPCFLTCRPAHAAPFARSGPQKAATFAEQANRVAMPESCPRPTERRLPARAGATPLPWAAHPFRGHSMAASGGEGPRCHAATQDLRGASHGQLTASASEGATATLRQMPAQAEVPGPLTQSPLRGSSMGSCPLGR